MRVGLFGGSFNPAHEGHAHVAETALRRLELDKVIWLVSPQNPLKSSHETRPLAERLAGARQWARGAGMIVSDAETRLGSQYTIDTLRVLRARFPGVKFVWIMGADSLASFHRWRGWTQIMREAQGGAVQFNYGVRTIRSAAGLDEAEGKLIVERLKKSLPASAAAILADATAPAWVYLTGPLNYASSTALRKRQTKG